MYAQDYIVIFYKLKVCGNPALSKSMEPFFPTAFAHFLSLCGSLYRDVPFLVVVWNQTYSVSEVCLHCKWSSRTRTRPSSC